MSEEAAQAERVTLEQQHEQSLSFKDRFQRDWEATASHTEVIEQLVPEMPFRRLRSLLQLLRKQKNPTLKRFTRWFLEHRRDLVDLDQHTGEALLLVNGLDEDDLQELSQHMGSNLFLLGARRKY